MWRRWQGVTRGAGAFRARSASSSLPLRLAPFSSGTISISTRSCPNLRCAVLPTRQRDGSAALGLCHVCCGWSACYPPSTSLPVSPRWRRSELAPILLVSLRLLQGLALGSGDLRCRALASDEARPHHELRLASRTRRSPSATAACHWGSDVARSAAPARFPSW